MARMILIILSACAVFLWQSISISATDNCRTDTKATSKYTLTTKQKPTCEESCRYIKHSWGLSNVIGYMTHENDDICYCPRSSSTITEKGWTVCTFGGDETGGGPKSDAEKACLDQHNVYRARHGQPPMQWNKYLFRQAQSWANALAAGSKGHSGNGPENCAYTFLSDDVQDDLGKEGVDRWYHEICLYRGNLCKFAMAYGHFTQVIWKASTQLGCAVVKKGDTAYTVARYGPSGNNPNRFKSNVACADDPQMISNRRRVHCAA